MRSLASPNKLSAESKFRARFPRFPVKNRIKYRNKCVLQAQRIVRGFLARKQHQPRYRGIIKIKGLKGQLAKTNEIVGQLRGNQDAISRQASDIEHLIGGYVKNIQNDARIGSKTIDSMYADIITKIDRYNNMIKAELQVRNRTHVGLRAAKVLLNVPLDLSTETTTGRRAGPLAQNPRRTASRAQAKGTGGAQTARRGGQSAQVSTRLEN